MVRKDGLLFRLILSCNEGKRANVFLTAEPTAVMKEAGRGTEDLHNMDSCLISPLVPKHPPYVVLACANNDYQINQTWRWVKYHSKTIQLSMQNRMNTDGITKTSKWFVTLACHFRAHELNWPREVGYIGCRIGITGLYKILTNLSHRPRHRKLFKMILW